MRTITFTKGLRTVAVALAAVFCGLAGGCSNNPYPGNDSAKNVLYVVQSGDYKTLDPTLSYTVSEAAVIDCIYECYYKYDHLKQSPYVLDLALGASEPERHPLTVTVPDAKTGAPVAKQGEEWTFHIKHGLRFQDDPCFPGGKGREITAADFAYSFRRMTDPKLGCPVLNFFQDKVLGMDALVTHNTEREKQKLTPDWATYAFPGVQTDPQDPYTFHIRLSQSYPQLRYLMAMHFTSPLAHEAIEYYGADFARHPVGCGSFKIGEYLPRQRIVLVKNPNCLRETYPSTGDPGDKEAGFLEDAGKTLPMADGVVFSYQKEGVSVWNLFQQGYLDRAGVSPDNYSQVMAAPGKLSSAMTDHGIRLRTSAAPNTDYYTFNMTDPVWGGFTERGRKMRHAIALCIDRQQYVDVTLQGQGEVAQSLLPPGIFGYDPDYRNPWGHTDVEEAKRLLAEAGYPGGIDQKTGKRLTLTDDVTQDNVSARLATLILKNQIERCGVQFIIQAWPSAAWEERVKHSGRSQFYAYGWIADYPDPENFFQLFYGPNVGVNVYGYQNPAYDKLFEQMRSMDDGPARLAVIKQMRDMLVNDGVWIYNVHSGGYSMTYDWVHDDKPHGVAGDGLRYIRVDGARRAARQRAWNQPNYLPLIMTVLILGGASVPAAATIHARRNRSVRRCRVSPSGGSPTNGDAA